MPYKDPEKERINRRMRGLKYYRNHTGKIVRQKSIAGAAKRRGISKEEVVKIWTSPCAFCGVSPKKTGRVSQIDHNHKTGFVRGALCQRCNNFVAYLENISEERLAFILSWIGMGVN